MIDFWESHKKYALDIELFENFWKNIGNVSIGEAIEILNSKLKDKIFYEPYKKYPWEEMQKFVLYEDIEFVLKQIKFYKAGNGFYSMQLEKFPLLVERRDLLIELVKKNFF